MATLGSLIVSLEANTARFTSDMGKAVSIAEGAATKISDSLGAITEAATRVSEAFVLKEAVEWLGAAVERADQLGKTSQSIGIATEALSKLEFAAQQTGVQNDALETGLKKLSVSINGAANGVIVSEQAFKALGISVMGTNGVVKPTIDLVTQVAQRFSETEDGAAKTAIAVALFGRAGEALIPLLNKGAEGLAEFGAQAEKAGLVLDSGAAAAAEHLIEQFNLLKATVNQGLANAIITNLMPALTALAKTFTDTSSGASGLKSIADNVADVFRVLATLGLQVADTAKAIAGNFDEVFDVMSAAAHGNFSKVSAIRAQFEKDSLAAEKLYQDRYAAIWKVGGDDVLEEAVVTAQKLKDTLKFDPGTGANKANAALMAAMQQRLKLLQGAAANEAASAKLANAQLDAEYAQGFIGIAEYAAEKQGVLADTLAVTLSIYDKEAQAVSGNIAKLTDAAAKKAALAKLDEINLQRQQAVINSQQQSVALTDRLIADNSKFAKSIIDLTASYYTLNGNTSAATALQIEQSDSMLRAQLAATGLYDDLAKLDAIEKDRMLNASKVGTDGAIRAMRDYAMAAQDAAAQVQSAMGNAFKGLEDQLVSLVATGKADFTSLANSIIADIARITIRENITGPLASILSAALGGGNYASLSSANVNSDASNWAAAMLNGGGHATGGSVASGVAYTVGEAGPETFVPNAAGTIVPNGGSGGAVTVNTHIDARGATTDLVAALPGILRRNNDALKSDILTGIRRKKYPV